MRYVISQYIIILNVVSIPDYIFEVIRNLQPGANSTRLIILGSGLISLGIVVALLAIIIGKIKAIRNRRQHNSMQALSTDNKDTYNSKVLNTKTVDTQNETVMLDSLTGETDVLNTNEEVTTALDMADEGNTITLDFSREKAL